MSSIRKQSIISSMVIYMGFAIGMLNTFFFTKEGLFTPEQYGLTTFFIQVALLMAALSCMAAPAYIFKFFPYYNSHLPPNKNDMLTWAVLMGIVGFGFLLLLGIAVEGLVERKYAANGSMIVSYYYWLFPLGFGLTIYNILEAYAWGLKKSIVTSLIREVQWRFIISVLIALFIFGVIKDFDLFIKLFSFSYLIIAATLLIYLLYTRKITFTFQLSKITRRYSKHIVRISSMFYLGTVIFTLAQVFDTIVIASILGTANTGIFGLAQIMTSIIQAPQRAILAASISHLSQAWKEKNMELIQRIYQRSSINQLIFSVGIFLLILLNYKEAIISFGINNDFLQGFTAFIFLGLTRIVDMGSGGTAEIIATSTRWRFNLISGIILIVCMLPITYILTKELGLIGPAIANFISLGIIYNTVQVLFLWKKFKLFPFTANTLYTLFIGAGAYLICYFSFKEISGFPGLLLRSSTFIVLYAGAVIYAKLSPDIMPVLATVKKRMGIK